MFPLPIDDEHAPLYSVGQVAAMLQVQQAFLRRLDEFEVVRLIARPGGSDATPATTSARCSTSPRSPARE